MDEIKPSSGAIAPEIEQILEKNKKTRVYRRKREKSIWQSKHEPRGM